MTSSDRDRREDGRPEQGRPRDRTGRPLPYGTDDVELAEDVEPDTVEEALALGVSRWDEGRFFEAHECLEHVWHAAAADDRDLWQGIIQVAVAGVHLQRGNPGGATALLTRAAARLERYPDVHRGVDVAAALERCRSVAGALGRGDAPDARGALAPFPQHASGVWFTPDPGQLRAPEGPTPVPTGPGWSDERPRRPRRRDQP